MPASPTPWSRKGMQIVAADGKLVLTVGVTQSGLGSWPGPVEAEANMAMALAAPQMAKALALVLEGASGANEAVEAALMAALGR